MRVIIFIVETWEECSAFQNLGGDFIYFARVIDHVSLMFVDALTILDIVKICWEKYDYGCGWGYFLTLWEFIFT